MNKNHINGSKVTRFWWIGRICLLAELHREGSVPAASAAGLFSFILSLNCPNIVPKFLNISPKLPRLVLITNIRKLILKIFTKKCFNCLKEGNWDMDIKLKEVVHVLIRIQGFVVLAMRMFFFIYIFFNIFLFSVQPLYI